MEKGIDSGLFVNDGSFMERFKQLEKEKKEMEKETTADSKSNTLKTGIMLNKRPLDMKANDKIKPNTPASGGKLAFSLKQKSKVVALPVKLVAEEDENDGEEESRGTEEPAKRQRLGQPDALGSSMVKVEVAPSPPSDHTVRQVADRLASLVAKNGRQFEHITRQRNPGDTPFKFLFDTSCSDYKYYEYRLLQEERLLEQSKDSQAYQTVNPATSRSHISSQKSSFQHHSSFQIPASALYEATEEGTGCASGYGESSAPPASDPIAMMEYYMKKAAQEERKRPPKQSKDEMPPPASLLAPSKRGHHMGDYIPTEELEKFLAGCNDVAAQRATREAAEKSKIQADNVGHKLLSKMGWKEGEGLGSSKSGRADPVMAGDVKLNNLGVGASHPGEVAPDDDIYEQYKKRMMLGYRYRPNPLGNPRKAYY